MQTPLVRVTLPNDFFIQIFDKLASTMQMTLVRVTLLPPKLFRQTRYSPWETPLL